MGWKGGRRWWSGGDGGEGEGREWVRVPKSQDLPGRHDVVDVDVLDERFHLRALLDLLLRHRLCHLFFFSLRHRERDADRTEGQR